MSGIRCRTCGRQIHGCAQTKFGGAWVHSHNNAERCAPPHRAFAQPPSFDALTSDRSYRKGNTYEAARRVIEEESGRQFDPQAVAAFLSIPPEEWVLIRAKVNKEITRQQILKEGLVRSK